MHPFQASIRSGPIEAKVEEIAVGLISCDAVGFSTIFESLGNFWESIPEQLIHHLAGAGNPRRIGLVAGLKMQWSLPDQAHRGVACKKIAGSLCVFPMPRGHLRNLFIEINAGN